MTCDPNTLAQRSSCLRCLTDAQLMQVRTFLLCRFASVASNIGGLPSPAQWSFVDGGAGVAQASIVGGSCPSGFDGYDLGTIAAPGDPSTNIVATNVACNATASSPAFTTGDQVVNGAIRWRKAGVVASPWSATKQITVNAFPVTSGLILRNESYDFDGSLAGSNVATWLDKSGNAHNWTTGGNFPTVDQAITANGHATIKNTGGPPGQALGQAAFFGAGGFTGLEVMAVYKHAADPPSDPNGVGGCFQFTQQDVFPPHQPWTDGHFYEDFGLTTRTDLGLPGVNTAAAFVCYNISVKSDNTSYNAWVKSANFFSIAGGYVFTQQGVHDAADGYRLGVVRWYGMQDYYFTGNTAAIYVWNRQLTAGERTSMRNYITAVYGTAF